MTRSCGKSGFEGKSSFEAEAVEHSDYRNKKLCRSWLGRAKLLPPPPTPINDSFVKYYLLLR